MNYDLNKRLERYYRLSVRLASLDTPTLTSLLGEREGTSVWGGNQQIVLDGTRLFVKKLLITDLEYENAFSTRNLFHLPTYYCYGVGSVGFGPFRELVSHVKTTNWVLGGSIEHFPLMYHYRILPPSGKRPQVSRKERTDYVRYWNRSKRIGRYMEERAKARHEICVFLEWFPHSLDSFLSRNPARSADVIEQMKRVHAFLHRHHVVHFDCHHDNILTDGSRVYLTDFGLLLDREFELSEAEQAFLTDNRLYDCGEFLSGFGVYAHRQYNRMSQSRKARLQCHYGLDEKGQSRSDQLAILMNNFEEICDRGWLKFPPSYAEAVVKYRDAILVMDDFFTRMWAGSKKNHRYDRTRLSRALREVQYLR
jgi:serine/threonine protein kinase